MDKMGFEFSTRKTNKQPASSSQQLSNARCTYFCLSGTLESVTNGENGKDSKQNLDRIKLDDQPALLPTIMFSDVDDCSDVFERKPARNDPLMQSSSTIVETDLDTGEASEVTYSIKGDRLVSLLLKRTANWQKTQSLPDLIGKPSRSVRLMTGNFGSGTCSTELPATNTASSDLTSELDISNSVSSDMTTRSLPCETSFKSTIPSANGKGDRSVKAAQLISSSSKRNDSSQALMRQTKYRRPFDHTSETSLTLLEDILIAPSSAGISPLQDILAAAREVNKVGRQLDLLNLNGSNRNIMRPLTNVNGSSKTCIMDIHRSDLEIEHEVGDKSEDEGREEHLSSYQENPVEKPSFMESLRRLLILPNRPSSASSDSSRSDTKSIPNVNDIRREKVLDLLSRADSTRSLNNMTKSFDDLCENTTVNLIEDDDDGHEKAPPSHEEITDPSENAPPQKNPADENGIEITCRNTKCKRQVRLGDEASKTFKKCHNCDTYYCSRECRKAHWDRHKKRCLIGRANSTCKHVLKRIHDSDELGLELTRLARIGYLQRGRGSLVVVFESVKFADEFIISGNLRDSELPFSYISLDEIKGRKLFGEDYDLTELCRNYNPKLKYVIGAAILTSTITTEATPIPVQNEEVSIVKKFAKFRLVMDSDFSSGNTSSLKMKNESETLILTAVPGSEFTENTEERKAREICFVNIQRSLRQRGVSLRHQYPEIYGKLCAYVEDNVTFAPLSLFPVDGNTGKRFMCLIMPNADPDIDWLNKPDINVE